MSGAVIGGAQLSKKKYRDSPKRKASERAYYEANLARYRSFGRKSVAKWRAAHPEENKAAQLAWREKNRERSRLVSQKWREEHRERHRAVARKYYNDNREKCIASALAWQRENPSKVAVSRNNYRGRKRDNGGTLSRDIIATLLAEQDGKCTYCCEPLEGVRFHLDHFMPVKLGGMDDDSNVVLACPRCNLSKRHSHPLDFMRRIGIWS